MSVNVIGKDLPPYYLDCLSPACLKKPSFESWSRKEVVQDSVPGIRIDLLLANREEGRLGRREHVQTFVSVPGYLSNLRSIATTVKSDWSQPTCSSSIPPDKSKFRVLDFNLEPICQAQGRL